MKPKRLNSTEKIKTKKKVRSMSNSQLKPSKSVKSNTFKFRKNSSTLLKPSDPPENLQKNLRKKLCSSSERRPSKKISEIPMQCLNNTQRSNLTQKVSLEPKMFRKNFSRTVRDNLKLSQRNPSFSNEVYSQLSQLKVQEPSKIFTPKLSRGISSEESDNKLNSILKKFLHFKETHMSILRTHNNK